MSVADLGRVLVVIPTYNEGENLRADRRPAARGRARRRTCWWSTTAARTAPASIADELAAADEPRARAAPGREGRPRRGVRRRVRAGRSSAATTSLVEMDADGSHAPEQLPRLLAALRDADLVLGSRWVPGGEVVNWPLRRLMLSRGGNTYARLALRLPGARRHRRLPGLPAAGAGGLDAGRGRLAGLLLPGRLAWRAWQAGFRVVEVPITFTERERRPEQDEPGDRRRGAVAGDRVGADRRRSRGAPGAGARPPRPASARRVSACPSSLGVVALRRASRSPRSSRSPPGSASAGRCCCCSACRCWALVLLRPAGQPGLAVVPARRVADGRPPGRAALRRHARACSAALLMVLPGFVSDVLGAAVPAAVSRAAARAGCWSAWALTRRRGPRCRVARASAPPARAATDGPARTPPGPVPPAGVIEGEVEPPASTYTGLRTSSDSDHTTARGPRSARITGLDVLSELDARVAAAAEHLEPLGQDLFEVGDGAALHEHVPVGAGGLAFLGSGSSPSMRRATEPSNLHSQTGGISASSANGTAKTWPFGHRYSADLRGAGSAFRSVS